MDKSDNDIYTFIGAVFISIISVVVVALLYGKGLELLYNIVMVLGALLAMIVALIVLNILLRICELIGRTVIKLILKCI